MSAQPRSTHSRDLFGDAAQPPRDDAAGVVARALDGLDPEQREAATAGEGGCIVRAGAGTGKTRTIVARIACLSCERGVDPAEITVATFTNKAASEIRARVGALLGEERASRLRMGTFHSLGARILRRHASAAGLRRDFVVLDDDDARRLMREVVVGGGHVAAGADPGPLLEAAHRAIRRWKTWGLTTDIVESPERDRREEEEERLARVYVAYQHELRRRNLVDFGDLVLQPVNILSEDPNRRHEEGSRVRHLLVDEAQDANAAQVLLARCLVQVHRNVFAVGDEDQSIFSFQGGYPDAIRHIAGPGAREFALVTNRRCTDEILAPAVALVDLNRRRAPKVLRSGRSGPAPGLHVAGSERDEAALVADRIKALVAGGAPLGEIAVLARSAYALSGLEEALIRASVPYEVTGGVPFLDREEIRDVVSYLRLALDPYDRGAFERVANRPTRGIGTQALEALMASQARTDAPFHETCANLTAMDGVRLTGQHREGLDALARALQGLREGYEGMVPSTGMLDMILGEAGVGYQSFVAKSKDKSKRARLDNLAALRRLAEEEPDIVDCLERIALAADADLARGERVRLSTMHSSKGLEWDHVLCVGFDSNVIPSPKAVEEPVRGTSGDPWDGPQGGGVEEERRLAHVAFTRARKTLDVYVPLSRGTRTVRPSFFLPEAGLDPYLGLDPLGGKPKAKGFKPAGGAARLGRKGFAR